jgi:hypothetical protein
LQNIFRRVELATGCGPCEDAARGHPSQQGSFDIQSNSLEINIIPASVCFD